MNTQAVAFAFVVMVALASGLGYDSYKTGSHLGLGNSWDLLGSGGSWGLGGGHWGNSWNRGPSHARRYRRATVGYGAYNPIGHLDSGFLGNRWSNRFGSGLGWRNTGLNSFRHY